MIEIISLTQLEGLFGSARPLLLYFYADWCGPCHALEPALITLKKSFRDDLVIAKINIEGFPDVASKFEIRSLPAILLVRDKKVLGSLTGKVSSESLSQFIAETLHLSPEPEATRSS